MRSHSRTAQAAARAASSAAGFGRPKKIIAPSPMKLVICPAVEPGFFVDQFEKTAEYFPDIGCADSSLSPVKPERSIEHHRRILPNGFRKEIGVTSQPLPEARRFDALEQIALGCEMRRLASIDPQFGRTEEKHRRQGCRYGEGRAEPIAMGKGRYIQGGPYECHGGDDCVADGAPPPCQKADKKERQRDGDQRVYQSDIAIPDDPVARNQMGDCRRHDLHAG